MSKKYEDIGLQVKDFIINYIVIMTFIFAGLSISYIRSQNMFSIENFLFKVIIVLLYVFLFYLRYRQEIYTALKIVLKKYIRR